MCFDRAGLFDPSVPARLYNTAMTAACIFGVGAIGGYLGARLALSGVKVTGICRGAQLEAIRAHGLTLVARGRRETVAIRAVESAEEAGQQELVFLTVRAGELPALAPVLRPLLGPHTVVVTLGSGFPWWYFYRVTPGGVTPTLASVDSRGALWRVIGPENALGCVVYPAAQVVAPGVVEHLCGNRLSIGEPDGSASERVSRLGALLESAGIEAPVRRDIRTEIWSRLAMHAAIEPISVVTAATQGQLLEDAATVEVLQAIMAEVIAVALAFGIKVPVQPPTLLEWVRPYSPYKSTMLRHLEGGKSLELDAVAGAVTELARLSGLRTPVLDTVLALARLRARPASGPG